MAINPLQAPVNYMAQMPQVDLGQSLTEGLKLGLGFRQIQEQQAEKQRAEQARMQYERDLSAAMSNPTPKAWADLTAKYPQQREAFKQSWEMRNAEQKDSEYLAGVQAYNAIRTGNIDVAKEMLETRISAMEGQGQDTRKLKAMREALAVDPQAVQSHLGLVLSAVDPEKWGKTTETLSKSEEERRTAALFPNLQRQREAEMLKATSDAEKHSIDAKYAEKIKNAELAEKGWNIRNVQSQIGDRSARLNLDKQQVAATVAEKLSNINKNTTELSGDTKKLINEAAVSAATASQSADQFSELAKKIESAGGNYGVLSSASDFVKKAGGFQGGMTQLKQEYARLRNTAAIKSLPPGNTSDKDISIALSGFPSETASATDLAVFLRGMAKLQSIDAAVANAKTDWLAQNNGVLNRANKDFIAGDYAVKPGETFNDFSKRVVSDVTKKYSSSNNSNLVDKIPLPNGSLPQGGNTSDIRSQADAILRGGK